MKFHPEKFPLRIPQLAERNTPRQKDAVRECLL